MQLTYDPWMIRDRSFDAVCRFAAEVGYSALELSPRDDFLPLFARPRANQERVTKLKQALRDHQIELASIWTVYRWAEPNNPDHGNAAVRYIRRFIEVAVELDCPHISTEFGGCRDRAQECEAAFLNSLELVAPILEKAGVTMALDPHPGDWLEDGYEAVNLIREFGSSHVKFLYSVPHSFYLDSRDDLAGFIRYVAPDTTFVRVADTFNHRQPARYIVNPLGAPVVVHQHLNIGEGEINWPLLFQTLKEVGYDRSVSNSVFAWPERAEESARLMFAKMKQYCS